MTYHVKGQNQPGLAEGVSAYIRTLEDTPAPITLTGDLESGKTLYFDYCSACHGDKAQGDVQFNAPRLAGMTDWYMLGQMYKFRDGRRGAHEDDIYGAQMVASAQILENDAEIEDVIAYINTLAER